MNIKQASKTPAKVNALVMSLFRRCIGPNACSMEQWRYRCM